MFQTLYHMVAYFKICFHCIQAIINTINTLRTGLITILNVDINNDQWLQASLPVGDGAVSYTHLTLPTILRV